MSDDVLVCVLADIASNLAVVAPMKIGHAALAQNEKPPRYVWVPTRDRWNGRAYAGGESPARSFGGIEAGFDVHIWGVDYPSTLSLRQKLVTAVRDVLSGCYTLGEGEWRPSELAQQGWLLVQSISLIVPLTEADLTVAGPADRTQRKVRATRIAFDSRPVTGWDTAPNE